METIVLALVFVGFPALAVYGANRNKALEWLSPVVLCYLFGIFLGNLPGWTPDTELANTVTEITVLLAIPLSPFSTDFPKWLRTAPRAVLSFGLADSGGHGGCGGYHRDLEQPGSGDAGRWPE